MIWLANIDWHDAAWLIGGALFGAAVVFWKERQRRATLAQREQALQEDARRDAEALLREARLTASEEALKLREQVEKSLEARRRDALQTEERLTQREALVNQQLEHRVRQEEDLRAQQLDWQRKHQSLELERAEATKLVAQRREELQKLAHFSAADAKAHLLKQVEQETLKDAADLTRHVMEQAKLRAEDEARRIISLAIQRHAGDHTFETTTATVEIHGEDMKGRIIGREGRNIRAFEAATGVTVLIDDTPNAVVLSGFDPVRREIAREAMQRLILDGRIHPTRIEEVVASVSQEIEETIFRYGEESLFKTGLPPMHVEIVRLLGRLHFRRSFTQNILDHSIEVAQLMGLMASELGTDVSMAKRAGLLHDIGKALTHEVEGSHAAVGADFVKRYGEADEIVNAVASHHDEVPHTTILGILVSAADAISASRPGARSESMTTYIKRLENLEKIATQLPGVEKCFALQAGRELRVVVQPDQINDDQAFALARNIARKVENELQYPGQIRITVVRETRCVEFAK